MSAHPDRAGISGNNPNYYQDEPAELDGASPWPQPLKSHPVGAVSPQINAQADHRPYIQSPTSDNGANQQYFPPPPGPPPSGAKQQYHAYVPPPAKPPKEGNEEQYYPPPPPGPPPSHAHSYERPPEFPPPPSAHTDEKPPEYPPSVSGYADEKRPASPPPPSYTEEYGQFQDQVYEDHKPPVLPPRPVQSQGAAQYYPPPPVSPSQAPPQFVPPPASSSQAAAGSSSSAHKSGGWSQKLYELSLKASGPINKLTNKLGSEAFWPSSLDTECDKAARILKSFCKDGFYTSTTPPRPTTSEDKPARSPGPGSTSKTLVKIPTSAIANARGLAIFTTFRTGLHISGAGGSGVVVSRLPDGSWSPPAGFLVHTLGAGFMIGFDVYDCVCVLNTQQAVEAFMKSARLSLGGELAVVAGPVGAGLGLEGAGGVGRSTPASQEKDKLQVQGGNSRPGSSSGKKDCDGKPVWSYMKSRGFYAGVQADGTVIVNRPGANDAFYGERGISVERILKGQVSQNPDRNWNGKGKEKGDEIVMWPEGGRQLMEVLKAAEGRRADEKVLRDLGNGPTPGDLAPEGGKGVGEAGVAK
ncbi:hypothetical protein F5Y18DRAFT_326282 [Xylariaceae sp. FL1019]|nr:hypothetical protein F5Y18DRAFT_326282 [Xylariaceae sp. FL1019]